MVKFSMYEKCLIVNLHMLLVKLVSVLHSVLCTFKKQAYILGMFISRWVTFLMLYVLERDT